MGDGVVLGVLIAVLVLLILSLKGLAWLAGRLFRHWDVRRVKLVRIEEAGDGQRCRIAGKVRRHPDQPPFTARFSGQEALFSYTVLYAYDPHRDDEKAYTQKEEEKRRVNACWLEDESGRALVHLFSPNSKCRLFLKAGQRFEEVPIAKLEEMLAAKGRSLAAVDQGFPWGQATLPGDYHIEEQLLAEGDQVVVVGTCRHELSADGEGGASYRQAPIMRVLKPEPQSPLLIYCHPDDLKLLSRR